MNNNTTKPLVAQPATGVAPRRDWQGVHSCQIVGLVEDVSGSMGEGTKAIDATNSRNDLVGVLADPVNRDGFLVAVVDFSDSALCIQSVERATVVCGHIPDIVPTNQTNITAGIEEMMRQLDAYTTKQPPQALARFLRPAVFLFSDGHHNRGPDPRPAAALLKQKADLVTAAFGDDADHVLLMELATSPQHFYPLSKDGRALRNFLANAGVTLSYTRMYGKPATNALTKIVPTP